MLCFFFLGFFGFFWGFVCFLWGKKWKSKSLTAEDFVGCASWFYVVKGVYD